MSDQDAKKIIENLLFVAQKQLTEEELNRVTGIDPATLRSALESLEADYQARGLQIIRIAGGWQLATRPEFSEFIERLLHSPILTRLSPAALETLAIIAYRQPVTRLQVENIRGVVSDSVIGTLLEKGLIREAGRAEGIGRPRLYSTSNDFLRHFGLQDLAALPPLPEEKPDEALRSGMILPPELEEVLDEPAAGG